MNQFSSEIEYLRHENSLLWKKLEAMQRVFSMYVKAMEGREEMPAEFDAVERAAADAAEVLRKRKMT